MIYATMSKIPMILMTCIAFTYGQFGSQVDSGKVEYSELREASGLASSKKNPGVLWSHNDTKDKNRIYAMSGNGKHLGVYLVKNADDRDWEDIAVGPGPEISKSYIYIGNIGDNDLEHDIKYVYRCEEPVVSTTQSATAETIENVDVLQFRFPDGKHDAEALMLDQFTKDYYIVSKNNANTYVYKAVYPQPLTTIDTLECVDTLDMTDVVAGDISPDGLEILIKTYKKVYYWKRTASETIQAALKRNPISVSYREEPKGEGMAWDYNGSGYFTISEEVDVDCQLYYYPKIIINVKKFRDGQNYSRVANEKFYLNIAGNTPVSYLLSGRKNVPGNSLTTRSMIKCAGRNH